MRAPTHPNGERDSDFRLCATTGHRRDRLTRGAGGPGAAATVANVARSSSSPAITVQAGPVEVRVTNPDRIYFPSSA